MDAFSHAILRFLVHDEKDWTGETYYIAMVLRPLVPTKSPGSENLKSRDESPAVLLLGQAKDR